VSGDPQRGQYRRATWRPLEPISSKTAVSPSISIVERLMMMTVEKALPDWGRQRSLAKAGCDRRCRNLVTDGPAHASAREGSGHL
jgi:hypothetical protein